MWLFDWITKRPRNAVLFFSAWTAVSYFLLPRLPNFVQLPVYFATYSFFVYGLGIIAERRRRWSELLRLYRLMDEIDALLAQHKKETTH